MVLFRFRKLLDGQFRICSCCRFFFSFFSALFSSVSSESGPLSPPLIWPFFLGFGVSLIPKSSPCIGSGESEALLQVIGWEDAGACHLSQHSRCSGHVGQSQQLVFWPLHTEPASVTFSNRWIQLLPEAALTAFCPHLCSDFHLEWDIFCSHR